MLLCFSERGNTKCVNDLSLRDEINSKRIIISLCQVRNDRRCDVLFATFEILNFVTQLHSLTNRFLIGREKPGTQSEVARLISETLEQEKNQQQQQHHLDDPYEHSTEEVSQLVRVHRKATHWSSIAPPPHLVPIPLSSCWK